MTQNLFVTTLKLKREKKKISIAKKKLATIPADTDKLASSNEPKTKNLSPSNVYKTWDDLKVCKWVQKSCTQMGLPYPTQIQQQCIPAILAGGFRCYAVSDMCQAGT